MQLMDEVGRHRFGRMNLNLANFTALLGMFGVLIAGTFGSLSRCTLVPTADPRLSEALAFEYVTLRRVELMNDAHAD